MARAFLLLRRTVVLTAALVAAGAAAGGPAGDTTPRSGSTFGMVTVAATQSSGARVNASAAAAGLAPKAVVRNPYNVPLLQNASSLRAGR